VTVNGTVTDVPAPPWRVTWKEMSVVEAGGVYRNGGVRTVPPIVTAALAAGPNRTAETLPAPAATVTWSWPGAATVVETVTDGRGLHP
jgi:hypothetical protein